MTRHLPAHTRPRAGSLVLPPPPASLFLHNSTSTPRSSKPAIQILPAHRVDIPAFADLCADAFAHDLCFQINSPDAERAKRKFIENFNEIWDTQGLQVWKAMAVLCDVNEDAVAAGTTEAAEEALVGLQGGGSCASVVGLLVFNKSEGKREQTFPSAVIAGGHLPPPALVNADDPADAPPASLGQVVRARFKAARQKWLTHKTVITVESLAVSPAFQGRGIGSALLQVAMDLADKQSIPLWLEATPAGHPLYLSRGWREVEAMDFDLTRWAGKDRGFGVYRYFAMLRLPEPVR